MTPRATAVYAVAGFEALAYAIVLPHLPVVVGETAPWWAVGLLLAAYSASQFAMLGVITRWSQRVGVRPVVAVCLAGTAIGLILTAVSTTYWVLLAGRIVDGASAGTVVLVTTAALVTRTRQDWPRTLGHIAAVRGGAALGGIVATAGVGLALSDPITALQSTAWAGVALTVVAVSFVRAVPHVDRGLTPPRVRRSASRSIPHFAAQASSAGLIVLAPAIGLLAEDQSISFMAPAAVIIGMAIGQLGVSHHYARPAVRLAALGVTAFGAALVGADIIVLGGLAALGVGVGSAVPAVHATLLHDLTDRGESDLAANAYSGRVAILGQIAGPAVGFVSLSASVTTAAVTVLALAAVALTWRERART